MMAAAAHNPAFAKKVGVPQSVAREFNQADKGGKMLHKAMSGKRNGESMQHERREDNYKAMRRHMAGKRGK